MGFAHTIEEAKIKSKEVIEFSFEDENKKPAWLEKGFEIAIRFDTAGLLNYYQHIFTKRALSKLTGVNESLLSQYAMGIKNPGQNREIRLNREFTIFQGNCKV